MRAVRWGAAGLLGLAVLLVIAAATVRLGVRTEIGRTAVVRLLQGMRIGPLGRLHIEGLQGDVLRDFSIRRLTIVDARGPWLEGRDLHLRWSAGELWARRFHAQQLNGAILRILRRPLVETRPPSPREALPVAVRIDQVQILLETLPEFSVRRGVWDLTGRLDLKRNLAARGQLTAQSRLHAGDGVVANVQYGDHDRLAVRVDAVEAAGGAVAGALGLPANERFVVAARGDGSAEAGRLDASARSGVLSPFALAARWDRGGTRVQARAALGASRLTAEYAAKIGPELTLDLVARHAQGQVYTTQTALKGRDLAVNAAGPVDWGARRTPGLRLKLAVADLAKWVEFPKVGPTRADGVLIGDWASFRYQAQGEGERLNEWDYTLARAAGPALLTHSKGEWRLQATLSGSGGGGKGLIPALMGRAPKAVLDGSRLPDKRILLRRIEVNGDGVKVLATGGQGLFGGLSLKGDATVTNLGAAHVGAKGLVKAGWNASEPKGSKVWAFTFDAQASNFGSGWPEADRLLGPAPHMVASGAFDASGWGVKRADLTGTAGQATFTGKISKQQVMALNVVWSAKGPFQAGPVEIAGAIHGDGKLTGKVIEPKADLTAQLASLDVGRLVVAPARVGLSVAITAASSDGVISVAGPSAYGPASAKAAFRFVPQGLDLHDMVADAGGLKASGALSLRDGAPSTADLTVAAGPGAFLTRGNASGTLKLAGQPSGAVATVSLSGRDLASPELPIAIRTLQLRASGPLRRLPFQVSADGVDPMSWRFAGSGDYAGQGGVNQIDLTGSGRLRSADVRLTEPAVIRFGATERSARVRLAVGGGRASIDARQTGEAVNATAEVQRVSLAAFAQDFVGQVTGALTLAGRGAHLGGSLDASLEGARSRDAPADLALNGRLRATLADTRLHLDATATNAQGLQSQASADLPAEAAAQPFRIAVNRTRPIRGSFSAEGEIRPLWDLFTGGERSLSGKVTTRGTLAGSLNNPDAAGVATIASGRFADAPTGLVLQNLAVQADFGQSAVNVRRFTGADPRGGTVSGNGRVSLAPGGDSTFTLDLRRFQLIDNRIARATASGEVTVTRGVKGQVKLVGGLAIDRADIVAQTPIPTGVVPLDVVEIHQKKGDRVTPLPAAAAGPQVALDVAIRAPRGVYVRGRGLNVELSVNAHVGGTTAAPDLTGVANVYLGSYEFAGKRFDFDPGGNVRLATRPELIRLNLTATREDPTLTAVVEVRGTAAKPEITLSSRPVLPQDEVLARVLFGTSAAQLSPVEAAQLASALAGLAGGGGFDILGNLRQLAGLDRLALGTSPSGTTVSGGKYLTNNVYLELTGGGRTGPSGQVEFRLRRNLSVVSQVGAQGDARLSVRFRRSY